MSNLVLVSMFKEVLGWCQWNDPNGTWEDVKLTFDNIKNVYDTLVEWHNDAPEVKYIDVLKEKLRYIAINLRVEDEQEEDDSPVMNLVDRVIQIYMEEDYEYVQRMRKEGQEVESSWNTPEDEVKFIKRNKLASPNMTDAELNKAAKLIMARLAQLESK